MSSGSYVDPSRQSVAQYLDKWLAYIASQISPRSHERYTEIVKKNLVPLLGGIPLARLRPSQITGAYAQALASGRRDGKGGLAASTVVYGHRLLK